jgi:hypothetical protein
MMARTARFKLSGEEIMNEQGKSLKQRAYHEFKEFLLIALYLWAFLSMFIEYKSMVLAQRGFSFVAHGVALINALALGKIMLIVRAFHVGDQANDAPLIYPTLLKSAVFAVVLMFFKILEDAVVGHFHGKSFSASIADLGGGSWRSILLLTVMLFVVLIPLTAFTELRRVLGEGKLTQVFLRPRHTIGMFNIQEVSKKN